MTEAGELSVLRVTLVVACTATLLVAPVAIGTGWLLARRRFPLRSVVETLVALPLVLPPTAVGYLLLRLLGRGGPLSEGALGFDPDLLFTWKAAVLASAVVSFPLAARSARAAFEAVDPRYELMARSLGLPRWRVFARVTLPLARRGLAAALLLGFARALGEFGATVIVAGNIPGRTQTLALAIFEDIQLGDDRRALVWVGCSVALAFGVILLSERLLARQESRA
jgi:molybdate transport system permease protein